MSAPADSRLAVALIGAGRIGKIHAANAAAHPTLSLRYVIDAFAAVAAGLAGRYGATATTLEHALADPAVAGVIVASPTDQHLTHCLQSAAAGKAVFCAAADIDTAKVLLRTASGRIAFISNSRRSGYGYDQRIEAFCSGGAVRADNMTTTTVTVWGEDGARRAPFQNFFLERYADAYRLEMDHFAAVLRGETPAVGLDDGLRALEIAEAAASSLACGRTVVLSAVG